MQIINGINKRPSPYWRGVGVRVYLKDHLGSIRAVLDTTNTVVSAQDYDCWGYLFHN